MMLKDSFAHLLKVLLYKNESHCNVRELKLSSMAGEMNFENFKFPLGSAEVDRGKELNVNLF